MKHDKNKIATISETIKANLALVVTTITIITTLTGIITYFVVSNNLLHSVAQAQAIDEQTNANAHATFITHQEMNMKLDSIDTRLKSIEGYFHIVPIDK